jgi:hypothetical protein
MAVHLYGTPGQDRFDFMWDILIKGAHAYILLVAANQPDGFNYAREIFSFMNQRVQVPMMICLTHMDCPGAWTPDEIMRTLGPINEQNKPPIIPVNPNNRTSVVEALSILTELFA